jgi:integrase
MIIFTLSEIQLFLKRQTNENEHPLSTDTLATALKLILKDAGLPRMRIHDLRHSYATIRLQKSHNIMDVSYQMGHSNISITHDVYTHWIPGKFRNQVDDLDVHPAAPYPHPEHLTK